MELGTGNAEESTALRTALAGLSEDALGRLRVSSSVPGRRGPHVSATQLIEVVTGTTQQNASLAWAKLKEGEFLNTSGAYVETYRFPGQRGGRASEVVSLPTALQIIMALPGRTAAAVRVRASVLLVRFLAGDLSLVGEVYGMNQLQEYLREHHPEHPLAAFREAHEAGQTGPTPSSFDDEELAVRREGLANKRRRLQDEQHLHEQRHQAALQNVRLGAARTEAAWAAFEKELREKVAAGELAESDASRILRGPRRRVFAPLGELLRKLDPRFDEVVRKLPFARLALQRLRDGGFAPKPSTDVSQTARYEEVIWYEDDLVGLFRFGLDLCERLREEERRRSGRGEGQQVLFGAVPRSELPLDRAVPPQEELVARVA